MLKEEIRRIFESVGFVSEELEEESFENIGVTSLETVEIASRIGKKFNIQISGENILQLSSLKNVIKFVSQQLAIKE